MGRKLFVKWKMVLPAGHCSPVTAPWHEAGGGMLTLTVCKLPAPFLS